MDCLGPCFIRPLFSGGDRFAVVPTHESGDVALDCSQAPVYGAQEHTRCIKVGPISFCAVLLLFFLDGRESPPNDSSFQIRGKVQGEERCSSYLQFEAPPPRIPTPSQNTALFF